MSNASYIEAVISGKQPLAVYRVNHGWSDTPPNDAIVLAGSFRPLHRAHRSLLETGLSTAGRALTPCFEISVRNVEKPEIATSDLDKRVQQFQEPGDIVIVTCAATFLEKARLMPGTTFVIGYDTAIRLFDDRFYADTDSITPSLDAMSELRDLGSRFIVGGRHGADGTFNTVRDMFIPPGFEGLLIEIPEEKFSDRISSTQLRSSQTSD